MSINKYFEKEGIEITDNNQLPKGQRTQNNVRRVINAVRAAEADFVDELNAANKRCQEAQDKVVELMQKVDQQAAELRQFRVLEVIESEGLVEKLTQVERKAICNVAS